MKKFKAFFRGHAPSRRARIIINVLLILILLFVIYVLKNAPALSDMMALRTAETQRLVGPGEVLAYAETGNEYYTGIYLIDEGEGAALFTGNDPNSYSSWEHKLHYRKKTGSVTLIPEPNRTFTSRVESISVFAFDDYPQAESAELEITIEADYNDTDFSHTYSVRASRQHDGVFIFTIYRALGNEYVEIESYALARLCETTLETMSMNAAFPADVRLYDSAGGLIDVVDATIKSRVYAERERITE